MNGQIILPAVSESEIAALKQEIADSGMMPPIAVWRGEIIGVSRLAACFKLGILPEFEFLDDNDAPANLPEYAASFITAAQRAIAAAQMSMASGHGGQREQGSRLRLPTVAQAATLFGVSERAVKRARKVLQHGDAELIRRCMLPLTAPEHERLTVSKAAEILEANVQRERAEAKDWEEQRERAYGIARERLQSCDGPGP